MTPRFEEQARGLAKRWQDEFRNVMEAMADLRPDLELMADPPDAAGELLWWKQSFDAAPGSAAWIGIAEDGWHKLGQRILAAAGIESAAPQELKNTFLEVLRQSLGGLAIGLGSIFGRDVACTEGNEEQPAQERCETFWFSLAAGGEAFPPFSFALSHALLEAAFRSGAKAAQQEEPAEEPAAETDADPVSPAHGTLDLLLDVEMPVSVSFGRTQVRVQDVLKLITGSIVELDRSISEPVEVIVNNCVIARGEVVVVDGNYGVRIQEVVSRRERLQQSRKYMLPAHGHRR